MPEPSPQNEHRHRLVDLGVRVLAWARPNAERGARELDGVARGAAAGAFAAAVFVGVDLATRTRWGAEGARTYVGALLALGVAAFGLAGASLALLGRIADGLVRPARARWRKILFSLLVSGALGALVAAPLLQVTLRGALQGSRVAASLPYLGWVGAAAAVFVWTALARRAAGWRDVTFLGGSCAVALALLLADSRVLGGRHHGMHLSVEIGAYLLLVGAAMRWSARLRGGSRAALVGIGAVSLTSAALFARSPRARDHDMTALRHLVHEPSTASTLYAGALRVQHRWTARMSIAPKWTAGEIETGAQAEASAKLRAACGNCNVVVYFVDTLRADTAADPAIMPNAAAFGERALRFPNTYSTASDTLRALPTLLGGRYDGVTDASFLQHVKSKNLDNALFIPTSAHEYLTAQLPAFHFDEVESVADHQPERTVWGYGADVSTGDALAERAVAWMRDRGDRRFFAWLYNFDLHGWRELRDERLLDSSEYGDRPEDRYLAVAHMVDHSLGIVLEGLEELGIADRTIVVLVSDHGEALGYRGYWTHSTFLWEPLVRVPLAIRVPGLEPRPVSQTTSLVDVAPTLARFLNPAVESGAYHGVDLLRFYADPETSRELPLLLHATSEGKPSAVGVVVDDRKLVVRAEGGPAQLHDLSNVDPDETDLLLVEPDHAAHLLDEIATSPLLAAPPP